MTNQLVLPSDTNQVRGLAQYAIDFLAGRFAPPGEAALAAVERFHLDSIACAVSALACGTNAPRVLREEALEYRLADGRGATVFGSHVAVRPEKAVAANCAAVREWDANGTNFGYNAERGHIAGEFGHNDFYPVAIAAAQQRGLDGRQTLLAMLAIDEIRGRLAEVFSLKTHKIDHVVHGAIASAVVYGAVMGATVDQIESAVGHGRRSLHPVSRDPARQATVGFQGRIGRAGGGNRGAFGASRAARIRWTGRHLSQPGGDLLPV